VTTFPEQGREVRGPSRGIVEGKNSDYLTLPWRRNDQKSIPRADVIRHGQKKEKRAHSSKGRGCPSTVKASEFGSKEKKERKKGS